MQWDLRVRFVLDWVVRETPKQNAWLGCDSSLNALVLVVFGQNETRAPGQGVPEQKFKNKSTSKTSMMGMPKPLDFDNFGLEPVGEDFGHILAWAFLLEAWQARFSKQAAWDFCISKQNAQGRSDHCQW